MNEMGKKKTNPRNKPRSEADVKRAIEKGKEIGILGSYHMTLYALKNELNMPDEDVKRFAMAFNYVVDSYRKGDITLKDLQSVCKDEYGLEFVLTDEEEDT